MEEAVVLRGEDPEGRGGGGAQEEGLEGLAGADAVGQEGAEGGAQGLCRIEDEGESQGFEIADSIAAFHGQDGDARGHQQA